ncbi:hypothetical protein ACLOJK_032374 [Asimina triloba]
MADNQTGQIPVSRSNRAIGRPATTNAFLRRLHEHTPNSAQAMGFLTLVTSGGILLLLTGLALAVPALAFVFFTPLIILLSPVWVPAGAVLFVAIAGLLSMCVFGVVGLAGASWTYKYARGWHPPGSDRVDYARSRIADTASHMKDYAREYSVYLQSKVKDAAPGA